MSEPPPPPRAPEPREPRNVEEWLRPFLTDITLWPVTIVVVVVLTTLGGTLLLWAIREHRPAAIMALVLVLVGSVESVLREWRRRRFGPVCGAVLAWWLLSAAAGCALVLLGLF